MSVNLSQKLIFREKITQPVCDSVFMQYHIVDTNKPLVITFEAMSSGISTDKFEQWNDTIATFSFIENLGYNVISFIHKENTYYRSKEFVNFIQELAGSLDIFGTKIGYGISLGGFASALFANGLKLDTCLLLMPQSSFSNNIAPWEPKSRSSSKHEEWNDGFYNDATTCCCPVTIIYDPLYPVDVSHVKRFSCDITHVYLYGVGHRIPRALNHMGILSTVVSSFLLTGKVPSDYYKLIRRRRYLKYYLKHLIKNPTGKLSVKRRWVFMQLYLKLSISKTFLAT